MLTNATGDQLEYYMKNAELDPATRAALGDLQQQRATLDTLQQSITRHQSEADSIANDQQRLRNNMTALKGSAEEKQLLQRYVKQLNDQEDRLKTIRDERDRTRERVGASARTRFWPSQPAAPVTTTSSGAETSVIRHSRGEEVVAVPHRDRHDAHRVRDLRREYRAG